MDEKKSFGESLEAFFAGKGFYIVLFLCVTVIGLSAYSMLTGGKANVEIGDDLLGESLSEDPYEDAVKTGLTEYPVVNKPAPTKTPETPAPTPVPSAPAVNEQPVINHVQQPTAVAADYFVWPVNGEVMGEYSMAALVYNQTMADWRTHDGIDIAAEVGAQVRTAARGVVEKVYEDDLMGTTVVIDHGNGVKSRYSNLAMSPAVSEGDAIDVGEVIGAVGNTALSEVSAVTHLHFAMEKDGESVDPMEFMP